MKIIKNKHKKCEKEKVNEISKNILVGTSSLLHRILATLQRFHRDNLPGLPNFCPSYKIKLKKKAKNK